MEAYARFTQDINGSPGGRSTGAFFDFDGTIIATHSVADLFIERLRNGEVTAQEMFDLGAMIPRYLMKSDGFEDTLTASIRNLAGIPESRLRDIGATAARERLAAAVFPEVRAMIRAHQRKGHTVAIVSSATRYQIEPLATRLGIDHVICTELEVEDGQFTGELCGQPCYGPRKVDAVRHFAQQHRLRVDRSFFYSNGAEDLPLLETVGHPVVVNPDGKLAAIARGNGWRVVRLESRGFVGVGDVARTLLTFGSALPLLAASLPFRAMGVPQREATNLSVSAWTSLAPVFARLKLIVDGEDHLWCHRPGVFIFNHQSAIDILITARLLREDVVGVAKKEVRRQPLIGPALSYTGTVFIDRDNVSDPRKALQPGVDALRAGKSVVIAPEGTRSRSGRLGDFKRGAFHMARQAGVPIVPIVIHNAQDALPGTGLVLRPAEVKVTVLEPISTDDWKLGDVAPQTRRIRELYLEVLGEDDAADATHEQEWPRSPRR